MLLFRALRNLLQRTGKVLRRDEGVTYVEVVVTLIMVMAATVVVMHSLFFSNRMLDVDMHKQQVLRFLQQELEYWVGRMYLGGSNLPSVEEMGARYHYTQYQIDDFDEDKSHPPIVIYISKGPITEVLDPDNTNEVGDAMVAYWIVTVYAEWNEPDGQTFSRGNNNEIALSTYVAKQF